MSNYNPKQFPKISKNNDIITHKIISGDSFAQNIAKVLDYKKKDDIRKTRTLKKIYTVNNNLYLEYNSSNTYLQIQIQNFENILNNFRDKSKKIWNFLLIKWNEENYNSNITFHVSELVKYSIYSDNKAAKRGFEKVLDKMSFIKIKGKKNEDTTITQWNNLFYKKKEVDKKNYTGGYMNIKISENITKDFLAKYIRIIPLWAFKLKKHAFSLIDYIYFLARQNYHQIFVKGFFTIKFDSISKHLGLPDIKKTQHQSQLIKKPILDAINQITTIQNKENYIDVSIIPIYTGNIKEVLNTGIVRIEFLNQSKYYFNSLIKKFKKISIS